MSDEQPDFIETTGEEAERIIQSDDERALALLAARSAAYKRVFGAARQEDIDVVMEDLTKFCRGFDTTYHDIPSRQQHAEGRREVWLRILDFTRLSQDALFVRYREPQ